MVEIIKTKSGNFQLDIKADSGKTLLKSISFNTEVEATTALRQTIANPLFERKTNHQGKFVISLKTKSGLSIGTSNTYSSEAGMENGIKNLMKSLTEKAF
ncbi:MAG: YegP family protein [Croceivirga sp.]